MIQDFSQLVLNLPRDLFILSIVRILETHIGSKDNGQSSYVQYKIDRYPPCQTAVGLLLLSIISEILASPRLIRSFVMVTVEAFDNRSPHYLPMPA